MRFSHIETHTHTGRQTCSLSATRWCSYTAWLKDKKELRTHFSSTGKSLTEAWLMVTDWTCTDTMLRYSLWAGASMGWDAWRHLFKQDELLIPPCFPPVPLCSAVLLLVEKGRKKKRRKRLFLFGSYYLQYISGCTVRTIFDSSAN